MEKSKRKQSGYIQQLRANTDYLIDTRSPHNRNIVIQVTQTEKKLKFL